MHKDAVADAGFAPEGPENPAYRWGEQPNQITPAETARRDMREIVIEHADAMRRALDEAGFKTPDNA